MQSFPSDVLNDVRKHLEEEKTALGKQIDVLEGQDPFTNKDRINDNAASDTEASEEFDHDRVVAMIDELKGKLHDIDEALGRIANGTYGFCVQCHEMIDTDRLSILPTASLCQSCERNKGPHRHV